VVGVSVCRVRVRDLRKRQQDKQSQTHERDDESARLFAASIL
jgi:hypothetical protein